MFITPECLCISVTAVLQQPRINISHLQQHFNNFLNPSTSLCYNLFYNNPQFALCFANSITTVELPKLFGTFFFPTWQFRTTHGGLTDSVFPTSYPWDFIINSKSQWNLKIQYEHARFWNEGTVPEIGEGRKKGNSSFQKNFTHWSHKWLHPACFSICIA